LQCAQYLEARRLVELLMPRSIPGANKSPLTPVGVHPRATQSADPGAGASPTYSWGAPATLWGGQQALASVDPAFDSSGLFSPGEPLVPADRQRARSWNFPVGYNLVYTPRAWEEVGFQELRALSTYYLVAMAIETRKDQIEKFDWAIVSRDPSSPCAGVRKRIDALTDFWRHPDGETEFATWLRTALHDVLTIDAPAFEIRRTRGGDIIGLDIVDGATIKVLVDDTGRRPKPPAPAYEQVIHGRPWRLLTSDELLYLPRNRRSSHAYGFGPVEQILLYINIGLRRALTQLHYYTSGNVPEGLINAPEGWNTEQISAFQEWFDSLLSGNAAERNKVIWTPSGAKYQAFKSSPIERDFEEWLARVICYVYSLPPTALVNQVNRATGETMQEAAVAEGNQPLMAWTKRLADRVIQRHMGHTDLEFAWRVSAPLDPQDQATVLIGLVKEGIITRNEARNERGMDPIDGGDQLMVDSLGQGPLVLRDIVDAPQSASPSLSPDLLAEGGARDLERKRSASGCRESEGQKPPTGTPARTSGQRGSNPRGTGPTSGSVD
jgi:HK97 family phage portal protein